MLGNSCWNISTNFSKFTQRRRSVARLFERRPHKEEEEQPHKEDSMHNHTKKKKNAIRSSWKRIRTRHQWTTTQRRFVARPHREDSCTLSMGLKPQYVQRLGKKHNRIRRTLLRCPGWKQIWYRKRLSNNSLHNILVTYPKGILTRIADNSISFSNGGTVCQTVQSNKNIDCNWPKLFGKETSFQLARKNRGFFCRKYRHDWARQPYWFSTNWQLIDLKFLSFIVREARASRHNGVPPEGSP